MKSCLKLREQYSSVDKWMRRLLRKSNSEGTEESYLSIFSLFLRRMKVDPDKLVAEWNTAFEEQAAKDSDVVLRAMGKMRILKEKYKELIQDYMDLLCNAKTMNPKTNILEPKYQPSYIKTQGCVVLSFFKHNGIDLGITPDDLNIADPPDYTMKKVLNREMIAKIIDNANTREKAFFSFMKDSLLRPDTLCKLTYGMINKTGEDLGEDAPFEISYEAWLQNPEKVPCVLVVPTPQIVKTRVQHHTWIGPETLECLKTYFGARKNGSRKVPPETITFDSPLFRQSRRIRKDAQGNIVPEFANKISVSDRFSDLCYQLGYKHGARELELYNLKDWGYTEAGKGVDDIRYISFWAGHKIKGTKPNERKYFRPSIAESRQQYIKAMPYLEIRKVAPSEQRMKKLEDENEFLRRVLDDLVHFAKERGYYSSVIQEWEAKGEATKPRETE